MGLQITYEIPRLFKDRCISMTQTNQDSAISDILSQSIVPQDSQEFSVDHALAEAIKYQQTGQLPNAEHLLKKILSKYPDHADAWHVLGIVAHMAGKLEMAIQLIECAIGHQHDVALYHANLGEIYRLYGNLDKAVFHGTKATQLDPSMVAAHTNLGIAYYDLKDFDRASKCQEKALGLDPHFPPALNNMGSIYKELQDIEKAISCYRHALSIAPDYLEPANNLGATLVKVDRPEEALQLFDALLAKMPNYPEAHCNRGNALISLEREIEAITSFQRALQLRAEYPEAYAGLARVYMEKDNLEEAEICAQKSVNIAPQNPESLSILGFTLLMQGRAHEAKDKFDAALAAKPNQSNATLGLGNIALELGDFDKAESLYRSILSEPQERIACLSSIVHVRKFKKEDDIFTLLEEEAKKIDALPETKAMHLHFALGKLYDDNNDFDSAFRHFAQGCALKRKRIAYSADAKDHEFQRIQEIFSRSFIEAQRGSGNVSNRPIFIVGMPRSGTTLTEQIIASHPDVFGGGELPHLLNIANWNGKRQEKQFPDNMEQLTVGRIQEIGQEYLACLKRLNSSHARVTDKMPANFANLGLIHLAIPHAKIIHVTRNPLDTCLSCYTRMFAQGQNNTYDLKELGRYYKAYEALMDHWRSVLPQNSFYDLSYENLVDDTENQVRRLLDYCDLEWHSACLDFHKTKRSIRTASVTQVRQPIYKTSMNRAEGYRKFLTPLIRELS